jgi:hypothetical protein
MFYFSNCPPEINPHVHTSRGEEDSRRGRGQVQQELVPDTFNADEVYLEKEKLTVLQGSFNRPKNLLEWVL